MKKYGTQRTRILNHLREGHDITPLKALGLFGSYRLGARVWDLRQEGYDIQSEILSDGQGRTYARYWLNREDSNVTT